MKHLTFILLLVLFSGLTVTHAQNQQPVVTYLDSLPVVPETGFLAVPFNPVIDMPILDVPDEAKILVWWPDTGYDYKMPNLLSPDGNKLKGKNLGSPKEQK